LLPRLKSLASLAWGVLEYNLVSRFRVLPPKQAVINVNYRCNTHCIMCNIWQLKPTKELSLEEFDRILQDDIFRGIERLTLAGGEPSLRRDLVDLVRLFIARMPRLYALSMVTNGFLPDRIIELVEAILDLCQPRGIQLSVSVSIDGVGPLHEEIRGVPGGFTRVEQTIAGLQALQKTRPFWLGSAMVLMRQNLHEARRYRDWCLEHNLPPGFQIVGFHDTYVANPENQARVDFTPDQLDELYRFIAELAGERSLRNTMAYYWDDVLHMYRDGEARSTPCPFNTDSFVLDALGDVYYCLSTEKIGNVFSDGSVSQIYYHPKNLARRQMMKSQDCVRCNSGCFVGVGLKKDFKRYFWFLLTGQRPPWGSLGRGKPRRDHLAHRPSG